MNHIYTTNVMNKIDFMLIFDAADANPNGDPDAGNLPRIDGETGQGLVTDVCLKRKIRNYVQLTRPDDPRCEIYVKEKAILNDQHARAYKAYGLKPESKKLPKALEDAEKVRRWMCDHFYDIRTFGAVMALEVNCGQVRGPVQLSFARSVEPVVTSEFTVTRCAVATERESEKQSGDNRTMGRKYTIPYGLYVAKGTVNPFLAAQTGFGEEDFQLLVKALTHLFDFDASAARPAGAMAVRKLILFRHDSPLGSAPAHKLYELVHIERKPGVDAARSYSDYEVRLSPAPQGIAVEDVDC